MYIECAFFHDVFPFFSLFSSFYLSHILSFLFSLNINISHLSLFMQLSFLILIFTFSFSRFLLYFPVPFLAAVASILLYGCTTWTLTKRLEKKLDANYTRMLRAILNKSWQQHPTRHQLYGHLPPITKTIQVRRTRHSRRRREELISDVILWTLTYGRAKAGRPARTYIQQLCEDTGCCPEDLPEAMNDTEKWQERVRDIRATSTTWWWWWWYIYARNIGSIEKRYAKKTFEKRRCIEMFE